MQRIGSAEFRTIIALTKQSDYRNLCQNMLGGLALLLPGAHGQLLEVVDERGYPVNGDAAVTDGGIAHLLVRRYPDGTEIPRPPWLALGLAAPAGAPVVPILGPAGIGAQTYVCCLGQLAGVWRFLLVAADGDASGITEALAGVATVFANLLALLDKFERDALTGLLNRQSFDDRFEDMLERHRQNPRRERVGSMPWLAIADVDHFKRVNDTYGHLYGDEILLLFSRLMRQSFRFDDLLFRYGGEEFVIILNNTDAAGAKHALERFRQAIEAYEFPSIGRVTVSIGWVGVYPQELPTTLMHRADKALYNAKETGRNRLVSFEDVYGDRDEGITESLVDLF